MARRERRGAEEPRVGVQTRLEACAARVMARVGGRRGACDVRCAVWCAVPCGVRRAEKMLLVCEPRAMPRRPPRRTLSVALAARVLAVGACWRNFFRFCGPHASRHARAQVICAGAAGRGSREVSVFSLSTSATYFFAPPAPSPPRAPPPANVDVAISRIISRSEHNRKSDRKRTPRYITTQRMRSNRQLQAAVKMSRSIIAVLSARGTARREIQRQARKKKKEMEGREGPRP